MNSLIEQLQQILGTDWQINEITEGLTLRNKVTKQYGRIRFEKIRVEEIMQKDPAFASDLIRDLLQ